jgi:Flp pilus assembly protein TadG
MGGRRLARSESGQAVVEFALILPILMLVIVGIFKFGVSFNNYLSLTDAVRSGARQLSLERGQGGSDPNVPCQDTVARVTSAAGGLDLPALTITVEPDANDLDPTHKYVVVGSSPATGICTALTAGNPAKVTATYPCDAEILGIDFAPGCQLTATATVRTE